MPATAHPFDWGTLSLLRLPTVRLPAGDDAERARVETILGLSRVYLSVFALVAVLLDHPEPTNLAKSAYGLIAAYVLWSIAVFGLVVARRGLRPRVARLFQACDIAWPVLLTSFTTGPSSPLMPSMMFALIGAAYRWGLRAALLSAAVASAGLVGQSVILHVLGFTDEFFVNALIVRTAGYLVMALLIGILADTEKLRRLRATTLARLTILSRTGRNMRATIASALKDIANIFDASAVELAIRENQADAFAWRLDRKAGSLGYVALSPEECQATFAQDLPNALLVKRRTRGGEVGREIRLEGEGTPSHSRSHGRALERFAAPRQSRALASASYRAADLEARLILLDPGAFAGAADLQFLQALVDHVGPGFHNHYLSARLRRQVGPAERARLARELHDGVVQSLIGVELRLSVVKRALETAPEVAAEIHKAQQLIHEEAVVLREMMQRLRPLDLDDKSFLEFIRIAIDRFRRETGIVTALRTDLRVVDLEPHVARALGRILQESLMNVRRHSHAQNAIVHLHWQDRELVLRVEDDGDGFEEFSGRLEGDALAHDVRMPKSIKEHARAIGAALAFESDPGAGSRVEVRVGYRP